MDRINKYLPLLGFVSIISAIVGGIYFLGGFITKLEHGVHTPEEKVRIKEHIDSSPTDVDTYIMFQTVDSIMKVETTNSSDAIRSRAVRDSIISEASLTAERNSVQIFQIKQQQDTIIKLLKKN